MGLYQFEKRYTSDKLGDPNITRQVANASYDWSKNEIQLNMVIYPRFESLKTTSAKDVCGSYIHKMKKIFGIEPRSEEMRNFVGIGTYFHSKFWENKDAPKTLDSDIERITRIEVNVLASENDQPPFHEVQSCSSKLLNTEIKYFTTGK